jgi:hypothetical protein
MDDLDGLALLAVSTKTFSIRLEFAMLGIWRGQALDLRGISGGLTIGPRVGREDYSILW